MDEMQQYTAIIKHQDEWWIGWIEEIPGVNCQERTKEELLDTLQVTLREAIAMNREDAIEMASADYFEEKIAV
jgi:predicted RNase H-like HicB family nuclease